MLFRHSFLSFFKKKEIIVDHNINLEFLKQIQKNGFYEFVIEEEITSGEDSDDEYNENMQKLEQEINTDYLYAHHPEIKQINYKELLTLSNITRNKKGIIIDPLHKTLPFLTRYEKAKILGLI